MVWVPSFDRFIRFIRFFLNSHHTGSSSHQSTRARPRARCPAAPNSRPSRENFRRNPPNPSIHPSLWVRTNETERNERNERTNENPSNRPVPKHEIVLLAVCCCRCRWNGSRTVVLLQRKPTSTALSSSSSSPSLGMLPVPKKNKNNAAVPIFALQRREEHNESDTPYLNTTNSFAKQQQQKIHSPHNSPNNEQKPRTET